MMPEGLDPDQAGPEQETAECAAAAAAESEALAMIRAASGFVLVTLERDGGRAGLLHYKLPADVTLGLLEGARERAYAKLRAQIAQDMGAREQALEYHREAMLRLFCDPAFVAFHEQHGRPGHAEQESTPP